MSKRIMNEAMCLAKECNIPIYYQDTDSMHLNSKDMSILSDKYIQRYNKQMLGTNLG